MQLNAARIALKNCVAKKRFILIFAFRCEAFGRQPRLRCVLGAFSFKSFYKK